MYTGVGRTGDTHALYIHTHTKVVHLWFPRTDSQSDRPHRISRDGRFQSEGLTGERDGALFVSLLLTLEVGGEEEGGVMKA